jgi:hypothetical protein
MAYNYARNMQLNQKTFILFFKKLQFFSFFTAVESLQGDGILDLVRLLWRLPAPPGPVGGPA